MPETVESEGGLEEGERYKDWDNMVLVGSLKDVNYQYMIAMLIKSIS